MKKISTKKFMIAAVAIFTTLLAASVAQAESKSPFYYGSKNQEAYFTIESYTYFSKKNGAPSESAIASDVKTKVKYILGYMRGNKENNSAIYPKYNITTLSIGSASDTHYRVNYRISAKGVFRQGLTQYTFLIPISHSTIYLKSQEKCAVADGDKVAESNFWYHWSPLLEGCPLIENVDFLKFTSNLNYIANTTSTYPEYNRLFVNGVMNVSSFFGVSDYNLTDWNPNTSKDIAANDYKHQRDELVDRYDMSSRVWSESEIRQYYNPSSGRPLPYIEEFSKVTPNGKIYVQLFYGNTGLDHDSQAFHTFLKPALANSQVIIYNGHSGIGKNLNLSAIENTRGSSLKLSTGYQIFFLGSCVPYSYYTDMFFQQKINLNDPKGTKNLDIIAFGDESIFGNHYDDRLIEALFDYADKGKKQSYQNLIGKNTDYFFGINGDEDNPTNP